MSRVIDFLRGGHWRGDSVMAESETATDEELDEMDDDLKAWLDEVDEALDWSVTVYEHANTDFRRRLKELKENAKMFEAEPLVSDQFKALMRRIEELEQILNKETSDVCEFLDQRLKAIEAITGEVYGFEECDDEVDGNDDDEEDDEVAETGMEESSSDLYGLSPDVGPEDRHGDDAKFFSDM